MEAYRDDALFLCRGNRPRSNDAYDPDGLVIRAGPKRLAKSGLFSILHLSIHVESAPRVHLDEQMLSSHGIDPPLPYLSGLAQQCLINRFLPSILSPLSTRPSNLKTFSPYLLSSSVTWYHPPFPNFLHLFFFFFRSPQILFPKIYIQQLGAYISQYLPVLPRFSLLTLYNRTIGRIGKFRRASDNDRWSPVLCYTPAV